jgi:predicted transcriptional regulator
LQSNRTDDWDNQPTDIFSSIRESRPRLQGRRSKTEMMIHILDAIKAGPEKPTHIMYKSNLSWAICQGLLERLVERGFVKVVPNGARKRYELTQLGTDVLSSFTKVVEEIAR